MISGTVAAGHKSAAPCRKNKTLLFLKKKTVLEIQFYVLLGSGLRFTKMQQYVLDLKFEFQKKNWQKGRTQTRFTTFSFVPDRFWFVVNLESPSYYVPICLLIWTQTRFWFLFVILIWNFGERNEKGVCVGFSSLPIIESGSVLIVQN